MSQLLGKARAGTAAVVFSILACSCRKEPDVSERLGGPPPAGAIGQKDPRWKGIPEEYGDEKGAIFSKKKYSRPGGGK